MSDASADTQFLGQYIPLHYHFQMLLDQARVSGFSNAINYCVPENGLVVELGGGTGVLSYFAAQRARKVWCVEHNPDLARAARRYLALNNCNDKVEVVQADARDFIPPEPVDVVICEMLHSALLREKQIEVIATFKKNYKARYQEKLPRFIPEATILAVQPVEQDFKFQGFHAPIPMFGDPGGIPLATTELANPFMYGMFEYGKDFSHEYSCDYSFVIMHSGTLNALRFITKNVLAIVLEKNNTIDWHNLFLILPIEAPIPVEKGDSVRVSFHYHAGASIDSLLQSIAVNKEK